MHDYWLALIGGVMIGASAVLLMYLHGKILGVSGISSQLLPPVASDWPWRISFIVGLLLAAPVSVAIFNYAPPVEITGNYLLLAIGGLLVGVGTVIGSGCTSGHGVCGLPRLSVRSFVATATFMISAIATVAAVKYGLGL